MSISQSNLWLPRLRVRLHQIPPPRSWTSKIVGKVGDGPLVYLPPRWRESLQRPWKKWLVVAIETWVYVPWAGFVLGIYRPPERLMTEHERKDAAQAIAIRSMREERERYWLRPYERWSAVWARAQFAADARAQARLKADHDNETAG